MDPIMMMLLFFLIMLIPMWLMGRSQKKRMQKQRELLKKIGVGDEVRTHSGFYGMIVEEIGDDTVILETEDGSQLKWARQAIAESVQSYGNSTDLPDSNAQGSVASSQSDAASTSTETDPKSDRDFS